MEKNNTVISNPKKIGWVKDAEYSLLEHIQAKDCLWNPKHPNYMKNSLRKSAYTEILYALRQEFPELQSLTIDDVRAKFKSLRTYFMKEYRRIQIAKSGSSGNPASKWELFDTASFLMASVVDLPTENTWTERETMEDTNVIVVEEEVFSGNFNISTPPSPTYSPTCIEESSIEDSIMSTQAESRQSHVDLSWPETPCSSMKNMTGLKRKKKSESDSQGLDKAIDNIVRVIENPITLPEMPKLTEGRGVAIAVENQIDAMHTHEKYNFILEIYQLIKKYKFGQ